MVTSRKSQLLESKVRIKVCLFLIMQIQVQVYSLLLVKMITNEVNSFTFGSLRKHTKVDTLFDSGSQVNLVSKEVVRKLCWRFCGHMETDRSVIWFSLMAT